MAQRIDRLLKILFNNKSIQGAPLNRLETVREHLDINLKNKSNPDGFLDEIGLVLDRKGSGQNSCFLTGLYYFILIQISPTDQFKVLRSKYLKLVHLLMRIVGIWVRHPIPKDHWCANFENNSRDQKITNIITLGYYCLYDPILFTYKAYKSRFGFDQNIRSIESYPGQKSYARKMPDFLWPHYWAVFWRALGLQSKYKWLIFTDFFLILSTLFEVFRFNFYRKYILANYNNVIVLILMLCQTDDFSPTFISKLACRFFFTCTKGGVQNLINKIFSEESDYPPFNLLMTSYILKMENKYNKPFKIWK